jgi:hypothetical protein
MGAAAAAAPAATNGDLSSQMNQLRGGTVVPAGRLRRRKGVPFMTILSRSPLMVVACLFLGQMAAAQERTAQNQPERPRFMPTRDVDIVYDVTRAQQPKIRERVRWLAARHLERVDGHDKSTTIIDRDTGEVTLLIPANRTFRKLEGSPRQPLEPGPDTKLRRGNDAVVAGQGCVDWSWTEDAEVYTACTSADGVLLRLVVDGQTVRQARSLRYKPQGEELFVVPPNYAPALAPEGGATP